MKSVYIHIPFCSSICSYCDFSKFYYNEVWVNQYLEALNNEIDLNYKGEVLNTLYIGGGTPSCLNIEQLTKLFNIIKKFNLSTKVEFTFECNVENINKEKLEFLYKKGVNRLSIGVQTFNNDLLKILNRHHTKEEVIEKINLAKSIGFNNINVDLIYAIPKEDMNILKNDLDLFLSLNINHISTYSLIIEPNTKLYIDKFKNIDEDLDYEMYKYICTKLKKNGYNHYEISNFAKDGYESSHNLTYWNNEEYYGFGLGASGYVNGVRYDNTKNLNKYLNKNYIYESHELELKETIENEFILGLRKVKGINKKIFQDKYNINIKDINHVKKLITDGKLLEDEDNIYINPKYLYTSNDILIEFLN